MWNVVIAECSRGQGERMGNSHINALLLVDMRRLFSRCMSKEWERVRERGIGRKRLKVGVGGRGEEITWCHDLALVHNLMMNTRPVQHGRLSQWGPISLWLDLWHIYPPLSEGCHLDGEGRSLRAEMTGGELCGHNCQSSLNMSSNPFRFHIGAAIKLSPKPWGLLMPLRKE